MSSSSTIARNSDPVTSQVAAVQAQPKLGKLQQRMLAAIKLAPPRFPVTANEAAVRAVHEYGGVAESYRKRALELVKLGRIESAGVIRCQVTGKMATTYRIRRQD